ncbi:hypothetical protein B0H19DRAFT_1263691 [Mycena capillaripes]|nr:hypothetical protein B0H19DRAFT_1263691 [Mycena capillaripes]
MLGPVASQWSQILIARSSPQPPQPQPSGNDIPASTSPGGRRRPHEEGGLNDQELAEGVHQVIFPPHPSSPWGFPLPPRPSTTLLDVRPYGSGGGWRDDRVNKAAGLAIEELAAGSPLPPSHPSTHPPAQIHLRLHSPPRLSVLLRRVVSPSAYSASSALRTPAPQKPALDWIRVKDEHERGNEEREGTYPSCSCSASTFETENAGTCSIRSVWMWTRARTFSRGIHLTSIHPDRSPSAPPPSCPSAPGSAPTDFVSRTPDIRHMSRWTSCIPPTWGVEIKRAGRVHVFALSTKARRKMRWRDMPPMATLETGYLGSKSSRALARLS